MKILLVNGSPHKNGCTNAALTEIAQTLAALGAESEIFHIGTAPVSGCTACMGCSKTGRCVHDDAANAIIDKMRSCDGLIVGTPVHYAAPNGALLAVLDRAFFAGGGSFAHKPAAAVACARRAGTTATLDVIQKFFTITQMPVVASSYWNMVHGAKASEVAKDEEGRQTMRNLARNMVWLVSCIEAGKAAGAAPPETESGIRTNFIR